MSKTPEQLAEEFANDWHKDCDYPPEILIHTKRATATVFLAGYKAGQEHPFSNKADTPDEAESQRSQRGCDCVT